MKTELLSIEEVYGFCSQLSYILKSGIPIEEGLRAIQQHDPKSVYLQELIEYIQEEGNFYLALSKSKKFDETFLHMVEIGEQSGYLDETMDSLAKYYQRLHDTNKQVKEFINYPALLSIIILAVMGIVVFAILPTFQKLAEDIEVTQMISSNYIQISTYIGSFAFLSFAVITFVLCGYALKIHLQKNTVLYLPFMKTLDKKLAISQLTYASSLLLASGYRIEDSMKLLLKLCQQSVIKPQLLHCEEAIQQGATFEEAILESNIYEGLHSKILFAGSKSGHSDLALDQLAKLYDQDIDDAINHRINLMEPMMLGILTFFIVLVLIAVMMPLIEISTKLG